MNNSILLSLVGAALLRLQGTHGTPSERNISSDRDKVLDEWKDQARAGNEPSQSLHNLGEGSSLGLFLVSINSLLPVSRYIDMTFADKGRHKNQFSAEGN